MSRQREIDNGLLVAALAETLTVEQAAKLVGCSAPSIHHRSKTDEEVSQAIALQRREKDTKLANSLQRNKGILTKVAAEVGLGSGAAVRYHISRNPYLQQVFEDSRDVIIDRAEENVFAAVEQGSVDDSWKLLKTLGKNRGYAERKEVNTQITKTDINASTGDLVAMLDRLAQMNPEAVEAEFEVLPDEDREVLSKALQEHAPAGPVEPHSI